MKCRGCKYYQVLNPHHIIDGEPVKNCSKSEHPDYCAEPVTEDK